MNITYCYIVHIQRNVGKINFLCCYAAIKITQYIFLCYFFGYNNFGMDFFTKQTKLKVIFCIRFCYDRPSYVIITKLLEVSLT